MGEYLQAVADIVAAEHPELLGREGDRLVFHRLGVRLRPPGDHGAVEEVDRAAGGASLDPTLRRRIEDHLAGLDPLSRLADALALTVQEDLVVVAGPAAADRALMLHVCFPSHWAPDRRRGASFLRLHEPVPASELLIRAGRNVVAAMIERGPFERFVWSLARSPLLDAHPDRPASEGAPGLRGGAAVDDRGDTAGRPRGGVIDELNLRAERQTTRSLGGAALFTIRIYVTPLRGMLDRDRAAALASAIRSMSGPLLEYKGLGEIRERLLAELDEVASRG